LKGDTIVLKQSLKNVSIRNAITKYNDIAYYLEQSGLYKEAIYLLEKVIENFPDRTVAYINLGDAYWGLGKKEHAKKAYLVYVEQMTSKNKKEKIPKRVVERTK
jgi:tetratricopeptide (TPR) repeat protein